MDVIHDQDIWETLLCNYTPNSGCRLGLCDVCEKDKKLVTGKAIMDKMGRRGKCREKCCSRGKRRR